MKTILHLHHAMARWDQQLTDWGGSALGLVLRFYIGWQFFKSGLSKIGDWSNTIALFRYEYQVPLLPPEFAAFMGSAGELTLPILLFAGFITRPASLGLFALNALAVISYPQLFQFDCPAAINDHFYGGALLLVLATFGPGRISLDYWLSTIKRRIYPS